MIQLVGHSSVQSLAKNNIDENVNKQAICIRVTLLNISYFAIQLLSAFEKFIHAVHVSNNMIQQNAIQI